MTASNSFASSLLDVIADYAKNTGASVESLLEGMNFRHELGSNVYIAPGLSAADPALTVSGKISTDQGEEEVTLILPEKAPAPKKQSGAPFHLHITPRPVTIE